MTENVIIIGGGPAGLSSAIYLARAGLKPLVFAGSPSGGQLTLTSEVENYPGFESILGSELVAKMRNQAVKFGTRIVDENIIKVDFKKPFRLDTHQNKYLSKSIIIATGAKALWLGLESEKRLRGKGVSACATCDGFFFKNKTVAVIGGGDTALEEALTLTKFAKKVYLIHRRDFFRASKIMQDRVFSNKKIEVIWNAAVEEIMGENRVEGVKLKILDPRSQILEKNKEIKHLSSNIYHLTLDGVFVAIGHKPDTDLFTGKVQLDERGYIVTTAGFAFENYKLQMTNNKSISNFKFQISNYRSMTSVSGVFAAGDCADPYYRQAATAAGTGVEAALEVERYLESNF